MLQLNDDGVDKDWYIGCDEDDDYCWITKLQKKMKESFYDSSKMTTIQYEKYNSLNPKK